MNSADSGGTFVINVSYAGTIFTDFTGKCVLEEPHIVVGRSEAGPMIFVDCECATCCANYAEVRSWLMPAPDDLAEWLAANRSPDTVVIVVHPDMLLKLASGAPTKAYETMEAYRRAFAAAGIRAGITDRLAPTLEPGSWVAFLGDAVVDINNVVVSGMLGLVQPDPHNVCTPGVTVMVEPVGGQPWGYPCDWVAAVEPPTEAEIAAARALFDRAPQVFQERNGWQGIVVVGKQRMTEERARHEVGVQVKRLRQLGAAPDRAKERQGTLKRLSKTLRSFAGQPEDATAVQLAERCEVVAHDSAAPDELLVALAHWCAVPG